MLIENLEICINGANVKRVEERDVKCCYQKLQKTGLIYQTFCSIRYN